MDIMEEEVVVVEEGGGQEVEVVMVVAKEWANLPFPLQRQQMTAAVVESKVEEK